MIPTSERAHRTLAIATDPERASSLPGWTYTDPAVLARERDTLLFSGWHYAGAVEELREAGDYITARLLGDSVIVIRDRDGQLRGFYNVCQHRAHELLRGRGRAKVITCPYHAWSYRTDGALRTARGAERLPGFAAEDFSLKPINVEVLAGRFVFFSLDLAAQPLAEQAAGLAEELQAEIPAFDRLEAQPDIVSSELKANWKVAVDNYLECYHCRPAHPAFAEMVDMSSYRIEMHPRWVSHRGELGRADNRAYPVPANAPSRRALFWWLWPTTTFNVLPGGAGVSVFTFMPTGVDSTQQWGQRFSLPGTEEEATREHYRNNILGIEDVGLCEAVQRGLGSRGYSAGRYVCGPAGTEGSEAAVHAFHRLVADALDLR